MNTQFDPYKIPSEMWEKFLPIGSFKELNVLERSNRMFSKIFRCEIVGNKNSRFVYVKFNKNIKKISEEDLKKSINENHNNLEFYYDKFKYHPNFRVVKPVFVIPGIYLSVTEECPGINLQHLLEQKASVFSNSGLKKELSLNLKNVGGWIRYFQQVKESPNYKLDPDELIEFISDRLNKLISDPRRKFPGYYQEIITNFLENKKSSIPGEDLKLGPVHSDFNLQNIIINGNLVTVLDFGTFRFDSYLFDISRLYHQLFLMTLKPQFRKKTIQLLQKNLLEGFNESTAEKKILFKFLMIRHTVTHLMGITRFWKKGVKERLYNNWVLYNELKLLEDLVES